ncbi:MAG: hypothetical protein COA78_01220 [Blastopirellula sp.]|nr:MAG: hypothetical protein COA78_01220 [Blastopirellula sp.]
MIDFSAWTSLLHEHEQAIWWVAVLSGLIFVGSLVVVPWLVVCMPEDYFASRNRPDTRFTLRHPLLRSLFWISRNLLGVLMIFAGIIMLVLPGQGLLTIAVGFFVMDFPGKHKLERRIIRLRPIKNSINWLRRKAHANPLRLEEEDD